LQGTYETLGSLARLRGWPSLKGKLVLTAGLGGMGGAQPLAITMNEGVGLIVEVDPARAQRRKEIGYVDAVVDTLEEAMTLVDEARQREEPKSIGLIGNARCLAELRSRSRTWSPTRPPPMTPHVHPRRAERGRRRLRRQTRRNYAGLDPGRTYAPCWSSSAAACSTTAITCQRAWITAFQMRLASPASSRRTSARCSAKAKDPSAGWPCPATRRIFTAPMKP
jgi:hypothetical protein